MSIAGDGRENDRENENQLAVWVRNVPTWLNEDRFYNEIQCWEEVDIEKSHCFKNKQDNTWVGVRYGWAIVNFKNKRARNIFLDNEEAHYVREAEGKPFEKLKVTPWFDNKSGNKGNKPGNNNFIKIEKNQNKVPLYKSELESDSINPFAEEFGRNCTENSIQAYRGKVHSYCTNLAGQGHVGLIEVRVRKSQTVIITELVVFHSDSVWMCFKHRNCKGTIDCAVKCGTDNFLPNRLRLGTEVSFTARKIPPGVVEGKRYQVKSIWLGSETQPNYISPPPAQKLDDYLEDYIKESGGGSSPNSNSGSKEPSPDSECSNPKFQEISTSSGNSGTSSPLPGGYPASKTNRPKPLKGGLNQLNSSQDSKKIVSVVKKSTPTNFAQAVAAAPTLIREEHSNLLLAIGYVDSLLSEVEALILVPEHGTFNLHIQQLDLGFKPSQAISKYLSPNVTTLSVTLKQSKTLPGSKTKYEIVRAHLNEDKAIKKYDDNFDPFSNEFKHKKKNGELPSADNWEELAESKPKELSDKNGDESSEFDPIDLDELDKYYDDLQKIIDYLEKELPKVIPTVANDEKCFNSLAHGILSNPRTPVEESKELQTIMDKFNVSTRIKNIFIAEYIKFREPAKNIVENMNGFDENEIKETIEVNKEITGKKGEENNEIIEQKGESLKKDQIGIELTEQCEQFYEWVNTAVRNKDIHMKKINLYTELLENNAAVAKAWLKVVKNKHSSNFISFLNKASMGEEEMNQLKNWLVSTSTTTDFATFITWLEGDTNLFRLENSDVSNATEDNDNVCIESSMHLFKNVDLSKLERAFVEHQDGKKETSVFIFRVVMFLRKCEINLEGVKKLHLRHLAESSKPRNKDFNLKIQNLLTKRTNQKLLDETNSKIKKECELKGYTPISYQRLDKFNPVLASTLCGFFYDKHIIENTKDSKKEIIKDSKKEIFSKERKYLEKKDDVENVTVSEPLPVVEDDSAVVEGTRKRRHENTSSDQVSTVSDNFCDSDFIRLSEFLTLSTDSGSINLPSMTTPETILWTFRAANVSHGKLENIYKRCQEQGGCSWQLQVSQLKLNPPLGVTVPDIAEYLSAYFGSIGDTDGEDVIVETVDDMCNDEDELLNMIQDNLYDQYKENEVTELRKNIQKSNIKVREADLVSSYKELFASHYLFSNTNWPLDEDQFDFTNLCSLLTLGTWQNLNVTSDFLAMCVRNIHENDFPYQTVLVKWAKMLETSTIFNSSIMDIFTIIKATMMNFDENVMDDDLLNITTTYCLYNTEGIVSNHLSPSFYSVQTRHSLIICHIGTTYCRCRQEERSHPLPLDHWAEKMCSLSACLPIGTRVLLHSTGIKDNSQAKIICQIADIVWEMDEDKFDPPETGIILPGGLRYKKWVQVYAEKLVAENQPERFANNSFVFNQKKYNALEDQFPVGEEFHLSEIWPDHSTMEMRKMFVFSEMGGMARPLLRSNWAAMLNTSDQEKERLINQTFTFFQCDQATNEMIEFIKPYVEKDGLRNAMKVLNQKYLGKSDEVVEGEHLNDTDSEKRQQSMVDETEEDENSQDLVETEPAPAPPVVSGVRNRQLSTDTIKDETLWMAENNLEQLWADNDRILAEEDEEIVDSEVDSTSEISPNDVDDDDDDSFEEGASDDKQLGVIGRPSGKVGSRERSVNTDETSFESDKKIDSKEDNGFISFEDQEKAKRFEAAVVNMSSWQPVASDLITSNRELIMALNGRVEYLEEVNSRLETSLQTMSLRLANGEEEQVDAKQNNDDQAVTKAAAGRCYVKIVKEGNEDDIAEVPTNSDGKLPLQTVTALYDGTSAIKYRVSSDSRTRRALLLEDELFHPPDDGWGDKIYMCTQPQGCVAVKPNTSTVHPPPATGPSLLAPHTDHLGLSSYYSQPQPSPYHMAHIWGGGGGLGTSLSQVSPLAHAGFLVPGIGSNSLTGLGTNTVRSGLNKPPQPR